MLLPGREERAVSEAFEAALRAYDEETERIKARTEELRYAKARAALAGTLRHVAGSLAEGTDGRLVDALAGSLVLTAEMLERPSPFAAMADRGVRACWCPPMDDSSDPEQHQVGCLGAEVIRVHQYWAENPPVWEPLRHPVPRSSAAGPEIPAGCYEASFGMVHVRPGCRCPR